MDEVLTAEFLDADYVLWRVLDDGRIIAVHRLMFHWTLLIDLDDVGYEDRYCYPDLEDCVRACKTWNGVGDPPGFWNRHPKSGRRRDREGNKWVSF